VRGGITFNMKRKKRKKPISEAERVMDRFIMLADTPLLNPMKTVMTVLYVLEGECVARACTTNKQPAMKPGTQLAIGTGRDCDFAIWQLEDMLEVLKANYKANHGQNP
jgi:hypothetical protein